MVEKENLVWKNRDIFESLYDGKRFVGTAYEGGHDIGGARRPYGWRVDTFDEDGDLTGSIPGGADTIEQAKVDAEAMYLDRSS